MAYEVKGQVEGLDVVMRAFHALKTSTQKKHLRKALGEASRLTLWAARAQTPKRSGLLYKSLGRKTKVYKSGVVVAIVGARRGFRKKVGERKDGRPIMADPTKYLHLVELGTHTARAKHVLRDAIRRQGPAIRELIASAMNDALAEAAKGGK
jgi:HK97 gp10 family phage protein